MALLPPKVLVVAALLGAVHGLFDVPGGPATAVELLAAEHAESKEDGPTEKPEATSSLGFILATVAGGMSAFSALTTSYGDMKVTAREWAPCWGIVAQVVAAIIQALAGQLIGIVYGMPGSVPVFSSIIFTTILVLNMVTQIVFRVSTYNKVMRMGTILFALVSIQLMDLAPTPQPVDEIGLNNFSQTSAIIWVPFYFIMLFVSGFMMWKSWGLKRTSPIKIFFASTTVSCLGTFCDNLAKVNGTLAPGSTTLTISFIFWNAMGLVVLYLTIRSQTTCDVSIFVPMQLCSQLIINLLWDFFVWDAGQRLAQPVPYLAVFVMMLVAVYIGAPEADVAARLAIMREQHFSKLSEGKAATVFGKAFLDMMELWQLLRKGGTKMFDEHVDTTKGFLREGIASGFEERVFSEEKMIELILVLWNKQQPMFKPPEPIVNWLLQTDYFISYSKKDKGFSTFMDNLIMVEGQVL